jgi:hypothetical protein
MKGIIEAKSEKNGRTSFLVNGEWYGTLAKMTSQKGDAIEFEYEEKNVGDKKFRNIKGPVKVTPGMATTKMSEQEQLDEIKRVFNFSVSNAKEMASTFPATDQMTLTCAMADQFFKNKRMPK